MREFTQAGVELIGAPAPEGTAEVVEVLEAALDAAGLTRAVIGLGDADLYRQLLAELGVEGEDREAVLRLLATHDLVGLERRLGELAGVAARDAETLVALSQLRGGSEVLARRASWAGPRSSGPGRGSSETYDGARRPRGGRAGADRPRTAARPRLLQRRDPRGL